MVKFEAPKIQGPFDPHPETPANSRELDIADSDAVHPGQLEFKKRKNEIDAEQLTPEQLELAKQKLQELGDRYDRNKAA